MRNCTLVQIGFLSALSFGCTVAHAEERTILLNLKDATEKLVDNHGNGYEPLYGTRNVRAVLHGIYYRGGANNAYNRIHKRHNHNPLPIEGLYNLCEQGFTQSVYLYDTNYSTAPHSVTCHIAGRPDNVLNYAQLSVLGATRDQLKGLLGMIYKRARDPSIGLIYDHCWNGWHASGIMAAYTLMQLCDFDREQAVRYWNLNTDRVNKGKSYDEMRAKIRAFTRFKDMDLTEAQKAAYCPNPQTLKFQ